MIFHISISADDPKRTATMLAELWRGEAFPFPMVGKDSWVAMLSALLSALLTIGLLAFLFYQLKLQYKSLKFIEPSQVQGSIDDLVATR